MVRSPLGDTEKRLLGCCGWLGKSRFCRKRNKRPVRENSEPAEPGKQTKHTATLQNLDMLISNSHRMIYFINYSFKQRLKQPHMWTFWWLASLCQARGSTLLRGRQRQHRSRWLQNYTFPFAWFPKWFLVFLKHTETTPYQLNFYWN